jgi:hypothetical protein
MRELMTVELIAARITVYELKIRQNRTSAFARRRHLFGKNADEFVGS